MAGLVKKVASAAAKKTAKGRNSSKEADSPLPKTEDVEIVEYIKSAENIEKEIEGNSQKEKAIDPTSQRDEINYEDVKALFDAITKSKSYTRRGYKDTLRSLEKFIKDIAGDGPSNTTLLNILSGDIAQPPRFKQIKQLASVIPNPKEFEIDSLRKQAWLRLTQEFDRFFPDKKRKTSVNPQELWDSLVLIFEEFDTLLPEEGECSIDPRDLWAIFTGERIDRRWLKSKHFEEALEEIAKKIESKEERLKKEAEAKRLEAEKRKKEAEQKKIKEEKIRRQRQYEEIAKLIRYDMRLSGYSEADYAKDAIGFHLSVLKDFLDAKPDEEDELTGPRLGLLSRRLINPETHEKFRSVADLWEYCDRQIALQKNNS